jgi:adenylylsulfate kinase-like enzyme
VTQAGTKFTDKMEPVQFEKQITVIIPLGLPGVGKSTLHDEVLVKYFKQNKDVKYTMVSNDQIRSELVKEY